ncbi:DOMON-like domain-containing protein [Zoogloea sp.]|uniref:DOMON-like domain-containing protein n=1 Tax=Zoogloea sp. TaxID=49181 RepID=UPI0014167DCC|nr:MAG: DOMON-like domain-containing protein [Zoogloea sp.]
MRGIQVALAATDEGGLAVTWRLSGDPAGMRIPQAGQALSRDRLWAHTCCELFVGAAGGEAYREFNFSPGGQWMAFDFASYRQRVADPALPAPCIEVGTDAAGLLLKAVLPAACLPAGEYHLALTAVVELADGSHRYWALRHPPGHPDFHHRDGFALVLKGPTP